MRRVGLVGGVTWHSTLVYYQRLNQGVAARLGPWRSADLVLRSLDYGLVRQARAQADHRGLRRAVVQAARDLRSAGAEAIVLCSNSLHGVARSVQSEVELPLLHIGDALAAAALARGHRHLALFGTAYTMEQRFLRGRLEDRGLQVDVPADPSRIDRIIVDELARGHVSPSSRQVFVDQLAPLVSAGATAFVAGCTEIPALIRPEDLEVPILDTLELHVERVLDWMMDERHDSTT